MLRLQRTQRKYGGPKTTTGRMKREKGNKTAMYALGVTPDLICATLSEERFCSFSSVYGLSGTLCKKILTTHRVQMDEDNVTPSRVVFLRCYFLRNVFFF